ncbi:AIM24 family protein, partial [Planococcus sp. CP5-4_YE]
LFNVRLEGQGLVAFTSHYEPLTLLVTPDTPVFTDPNATVAWSGNLEPDFVTDVQLKSFFGRGSGESVQMKFSGNGFVVVQPFEEIYHAPQS